MLIINGKQYLEGIDCVDMLIPEYWYDSIDLNKQIDPRNLISIYSNTAHFCTTNGVPGSKNYLYLHISGEYINPELPLKETIVNAIAELIRRNIFRPKLYINNLVVDEISKSFLMENLHLFIKGISGIEFCFDFNENNIEIAEDAKIINKSSPDYIMFKNSKIPDREKYLIQEGDTTYYSYDYKEGRKSTLKLYDRAIWLKKKNNEYTHSFINNNPFNKRIEFVFKRNENTKYLNINNFNGNYYTIIKKYIPYLAKLYKKYFLGKVLVNPIGHPYFTEIYTMAHSEQFTRNTELEKNISIPRDKIKETENNNYLKSIHLVKKDFKKTDKIRNELPDNYFYSLEDIGKQQHITPFDYENEDRIRIKTDGFVILKDALQMIPKLEDFKIIEDNDNKT